jgi:ubiquinone biosynthesis protein Coq4
MVVTKLNFLQDSDVNLLSVDYQGLLVETIAQTALQVINSTLSAITTSDGKFEAIIDFQRHVNSDITLDNMDAMLSLESAPLTHTSNNPITQTFSQQNQPMQIQPKSKCTWQSQIHPAGRPST